MSDHILVPKRYRGSLLPAGLSPLFNIPRRFESAGTEPSGPFLRPSTYEDLILEKRSAFAKRRSLVMVSLILACQRVCVPSGNGEHSTSIVG